ncbi:MAG: fibronectin type III domain-containing protein, partial [Candidatus Nanopelagicales bacterium]
GLGGCCGQRGADVALGLLQGSRYRPDLPQQVGLASDGYPWLVTSLSMRAGGSAELWDVTSIPPTPVAEGQSAIAQVGVGFADVARAQVVSLDGDVRLAAWITFTEDNGDVIRTRWFDRMPRPQPPTNVTGEFRPDGSLRISWTLADQIEGVIPLRYNVSIAPQAGGNPVASCLAEFRGSTDCVIPAPIPPLERGVAYVATVTVESSIGEESRSAPSAAFGLDLPADPGDPNNPGAESIMIIGSRGEVRGRSGVIVQGMTTGLVGETVMPRYRFPGPSGYQDGVARRTVAADGTFEWSRKTGKKIYIVFKTVDGRVQSDRIIIE